jgi:hypothetical protein
LTPRWGRPCLAAQRLADDPAEEVGKFRPIGAELKFEWNAGDDVEGEAQGKDLGLEPRDLIVVLVFVDKGAAPQVEQQQRQPHRQLWKEIMKKWR